MSRWFRHYAGMVRDDKLVRASIKSKQSIERVVWVWSAILESAAELDDGGRYEIDHDEMARFLRCSASKLKDIEGALAALSRVSGNVVENWNSRQFKSDKSAERTRDYRNRRKASISDDEPASRDAGNNKADRRSDDAVTSQERHRDAPETETETETEKKSSVANATGASAPKTAADFCKGVFDSGTALLVAQGTPEPRARGMVGRWRKACGDADLLTIIRQSEIEGHSDPVAWITAAVETRNGKRTASKFGDGQYSDPILGDAFEELRARLG